MNCQVCGASLKPGAKFCGRCGAGVAVAAPDGVHCPTCGTVNRPGAKFCQRDGTRLLGAEPRQEEGRPEVASAAERTVSKASAAVIETREERPTEGARQAQAVPSVSPMRPSHSDMDRALGDAGRSRSWLVLGAVVLLAAVGGGYWWYSGRSAPTETADLAPTPAEPVASTLEAGGPGSEAVEAPPVAPAYETPSSVPIEVAEAPRVGVGDRWVTEVVDHQDAALSYHAERTVTEVRPDRIFTAVRTIGKDYVRVVEYTGEWALVATHLQSGATTNYSPALPYLSFPLQSGKTWQARVTETDAEGKERVHEVRAQVESWETVQVPAGTFGALKVVLTDDISKDGLLVQRGQDVSWYSPEARRTVKTEETSIDPATGERRRRTISLVEYSVGSDVGDASEDARSATGSDAPAMDLTPLLAGIEDSCRGSEQLSTLIASLGKLEEVAGGGYRWQKGTPAVATEYSAAIGTLTIADKGGYTEFTLPVRGTYYGLPVRQIRSGKGNENGISFYSIALDVPPAVVIRTLRGKLNLTKRMLYGSDGPPVEARIQPEGSGSSLECNFSD